jgi:hypothetical protein
MGINERPTPETDELGYIPTDIGPCWPLVEHAQKLEVERNEIKKELEETLLKLQLSVEMGLEAVGELIDQHHTVWAKDRNIEWELKAYSLDARFQRFTSMSKNKN